MGTSRGAATVTGAGGRSGTGGADLLPPRNPTTSPATTSTAMPPKDKSALGVFRHFQHLFLEKSTVNSRQSAVDSSGSQASSFASIVIVALSSFETGQPSLAACAALRNASRLAPGIFAVTSRCTA